jgi:hypothetical protein
VSNAEAAGTPWKGRSEWRTPIMKHEEASGPWVPAIGFTAGGGLLAGAFIWNAIIRSANPDWAALLTLMFPIAGAALLYQSMKARKRNKKFGTSKLEMETMPGRLGERLLAEVQARLPRDTFPEHGVQVQISCYRRTVREETTTDSDGDSSTKLTTTNTVLWRGEKQMRARTHHGDYALIPVSFAIPVDLPPSTTRKRSKEQLARTGEADFIWKIAVRAEMPDVDYEARFEIPVYPPDEEDTDASPTADTTSGAAEDENAASEKVLWDLERDEEALTVGTGEDEADSDDPYAEYEVTPNLTEPTSKRISVERLSGRGVRVHVAPDRRPTSIFFMIAMAVIGALCTAGAVLAIGEGALLMTLLLLFFGVVMLLGAWSIAMLETTVTVSEGNVVVQQGTIRKKKTRLPVTEVDEVRVLIDGTDSSTDYQLVVKRKDTGSESSRTENVSGMMGTILGEKAGEKVKEEMTKAENRAVHLRGLHNKHEADWLAQQLRDAIASEQRYM